MAETANGDLVELSAGRLAALLERYVPGLVTGLHLIGSAVDGDFRPGRSDLDFVAVLAHPATDGELEALAIIHRIYAADPTLPMLDGIWITEAELAAGPDASAAGPTSNDNRFFEMAQGNRSPVTWTQLPEARTVFGTLDRPALWPDPSRLVEWVRQNAAGYWTRWHAGGAKLWTSGGLSLLRPGPVAWGVLGISRLHHTAATGRIVSKTAAGEYVLGRTEARWQPIVREALRIRHGQGGGTYSNPFRRRRDALDFVAMMIGEIGRPDG